MTGIRIHLMCASKKGISSLQLHRMLGIAYRSAWHLSHRIRAAMTEAAPEIMSGTVEADEVYIGGLRRGKGRGYRGNKTAIVAIVERGGRAHAHVMPEAKVTSATVADMLEEHVSSDAILNTDESSIYRWPGREFASHDTVNHQEEEYVRRDRRTGRMASTNAVEGYFGNFRRQVDGTHHHVSYGHLPRYSNEFEFKYNTRKITDGERTVQTIRRLENRRLTLYKIAGNIPSLQDTRESR
jgi:transposase-like protein